jgi:hypothetical protein
MPQAMRAVFSPELLGWKRNQAGLRLRPAAVYSPSMDQRHQPKRLMPIGPICSAVLVIMLHDFGRRGHARRPGGFCLLCRLAEVVYLMEKNRLPESAYDDLKIALSDPEHVLKEAPFTIEILDAMRKVPRAAAPDMPDGIVAATALYFRVPVISRDRRIQSSTISSIW